MNGVMGTIIVGVDESPEAAEALRWAVRESRHHSSPLTAVMAWGYLDQPHANDTAQDAAIVLNQLVTRAAPDDARAISRTVVCDLPARALLDASEHAELLVVGARDYGGLRGLLLGSVSQQCAHHTTVPIAIVRRTGRDFAAPSERIVVGIDGSKTSMRALAWALDEGRARDAPVTVVHAWRPALLGALDYASPVLDRQTLEATAKTTVDDAISQSRTDGLPSPVGTVVVDGGAANAILDAVQQHHSSWWAPAAGAASLGFSSDR